MAAHAWLAGATGWPFALASAVREASPMETRRRQAVTMRGRMGGDSRDGYELSWPEADALLGRTLDDRYRLQSVIGRGGSSVLYAAHDLRAGIDVAVKALTARDAGGSLHVFRFLNEAKVITQLRHPHVVELRGWGTAPDGMPYLVMELLAGRSLAQELEQTSALTPAQTLAWILPIMGAVAFAHDCGVLHRDLKPQNIFLANNADGSVTPKLLDFGIAKPIGSATLTHSGTVMGTPAFMSPEQALGERMGAASDVWSMGVVLFACLTNRLPFDAESVTRTLLDIVQSGTPSLRVLAPELPDRLRSVLQRALERDSKARIPTMRDFAKGLLLAAQSDNVELPFDPDPLGLPDWPSWLSQAELRTSEHIALESPPSESTYDAEFAIELTSACRLGHYGPCVLSVWSGAPSIADINVHYDIANRLTRRYGDVAMLIVVEEQADIPSWAELSEILRFYDQFKLRCVAQVVEHSGLIGTAQRSVMSTIHYVRRRVYPIRAFGSTCDAVPWLASQISSSPDRTEAFAAGLLVSLKKLRETPSSSFRAQ